MALTYLSVPPTAQKPAGYVPGDIVDFVIASPGLDVALNTLRLSGTLTVTGIPNATRLVFSDSAIGIHGFINNLLVSTANQGTISNQSAYPRWVKMRRTASRARGDICTAASNVAELTAGDDSKMATIFANAGVNNPITDNAIAFSASLDIPLNNAAAADGTTPRLSYGAVGETRISLRWVAPVEVFYGTDSPAASYVVTDLRLDYAALPGIAKPPPIILSTLVETKQVINGDVAQITATLPVAASAVHSTFLAVADEFSTSTVNTKLARLPGISRAYLLLSDVSSQVPPLETVEDMVEGYLQSFPEGAMLGRSDCTLAKLSSGDFFGIGRALPLPAGSSFGVQLNSSVGTLATPYYCYLFFRSSIEI